MGDLFDQKNGVAESGLRPQIGSEPTVYQDPATQVVPEVLEAPAGRIALYTPESQPVADPAVVNVERPAAPAVVPAPVKPVDVQVLGVPDISQPPAEIAIETLETPVAGSYTDALNVNVVQLARVEQEIVEGANMGKG